MLGRINIFIDLHNVNEMWDWEVSHLLQGKESLVGIPSNPLAELLLFLWHQRKKRSDKSSQTEIPVGNEMTGSSMSPKFKDLVPEARVPRKKIQIAQQGALLLGALCVIFSRNAPISDDYSPQTNKRHPQVSVPSGKRNDDDRQCSKST